MAHTEGGMDVEARDADEHVTEGGPVDGIAPLLAALEGADDLPLDDRLQLLRDAEASIAGVLEGLDGL
jgi:hypothetical protein